MGASLFVYYWEVRLDEYYELYIKCFPEYHTTPEVFSAKLRPELAHIVERRENGKLVGFAFVHSGPIPLLCVESEGVFVSINDSLCILRIGGRRIFS